MLVFSVGRNMLEHINHLNHRIKPKMGELWECIGDRDARCPELISYGPNRYCTHKDSTVFRLDSGDLKYEKKDPAARRGGAGLT
jgi:hypothetical protein